MSTTKKFDASVYNGSSIKSDPNKLKNVSDPLGIDAIDYLEFWVGNAKQAAYYYSQIWGFELVAYRGPETGYSQIATYVLKQSEITFAISSALRTSHAITDSVLKHGDTVRDIALRVSNCEAFYYEAIKRGAKSAEEPKEFKDQNGIVKRAAIRTYGEVIHSIIERKNFKGQFLPGFVKYEDLFSKPPTVIHPELKYIDHIVGNVELGKMNEWVKFYEEVLGFTQLQHFSDEQISTEYSALMSKVMTNGTGKIKFPINEPAEGKRKSQIEEYLEFHNGPGVQHIALRSENILKAVPALRNQGVNFLRVPQTYYEAVPDRVGKIKEDLKMIAENGVLVDRDDDGYLLQLFTKPIQDRPTLFFEIIQREGSQGFGVGNFKALFEALEAEQELRGNL